MTGSVLLLTRDDPSRPPLVVPISPDQMAEAKEWLRRRVESAAFGHRTVKIVDAKKQRRFSFTSGTTGHRVTCSHCGWTSRGRGNAQKVADRSIGHECAGVESYQDMLARHVAEAAAP
ncbi:hypothetical protein [Micromonospora sp. NBC_00421]|uniref:hypothetical protein n=1 Tax=Micromonospora sp. NBC_00421 TaxID=2975976 RepID=UPI002E243D6E